MGELYLDACIDFQGNEEYDLELFNDSDYACAEFIDEYFIHQWMDKIGPEDFSVFREVDRTNNKLESYHSRLPQIFGTRPVLPVFLRE